MHVAKMDLALLIRLCERGVRYYRAVAAGSESASRSVTKYIAITDEFQQQPSS